MTAAPRQTPAAQVSFSVQALLSLQAMLFCANTQPFAGLQESVVHTLLSLHVTAEPVQMPLASQASFWLHALLSSQLAAN